MGALRIAALALITFLEAAREYLKTFNQMEETAPAGRAGLAARIKAKNPHVTKTPRMMARVPEVMAMLQQYVLPRALERAKAELQKAGVELKL